MTLPLKALSIKQPWAWLIVNGHKDIENRDWRTHFRGPVAIHAGKKMDEAAYASLIRSSHAVTGEPFDVAAPVTHHQGGIVGVAEIVDCVERSGSSWFVGPYGFVIRNARPVPFIPVKGALGFFDWQDRRL
jgi:hypothetical protein